MVSRGKIRTVDNSRGCGQPRVQDAIFAVLVVPPEDDDPEDDEPESFDEEDEEEDDDDDDSVDLLSDDLLSDDDLPSDDEADAFASERLSVR